MAPRWPRRCPTSSTVIGLPSSWMPSVTRYEQRRSPAGRIDRVQRRRGGAHQLAGVQHRAPAGLSGLTTGSSTAALADSGSVSLCVRPDRGGRRDHRFHRGQCDHEARAPGRHPQAGPPAQGACRPGVHRHLQRPPGRPDPLPGGPRCADRTTQPGPHPRSYRADAGPGPPIRQSGGRSVHRSRRIQGCERLPRPRGRGPAPPSGGRTALGDHARERQHRPPGWRRVRRPGRREHHGRRARAGGRATDRGAPGPVRATRPAGQAADPHGQHRHRHRRPGLGHRAPPGCRHRPVRGQSGRQELLRGLRARDAHRRPGPPPVGDGPSGRTAALDQFHLVYQPIFNLAGGRTTGVEALLRWDHPGSGRGPTGHLHPHSRGHGDDHRGRAAGCSTRPVVQGARWHAKGYQLDVSVNVSARQLETDQLVEDVRLACNRPDSRPRR